MFKIFFTRIRTHKTPRYFVFFEFSTSNRQPLSSRGIIAKRISFAVPPKIRQGLRFFLCASKFQKLIKSRELFPDSELFRKFIQAVTKARAPYSCGFRAALLETVNFQAFFDTSFNRRT